MESRQVRRARERNEVKCSGPKYPYHAQIDHTATQEDIDALKIWCLGWYNEGHEE